MSGQRPGWNPGGGGTYCGEHCHCALMPTDEPVSGDISAGVPGKKGKGEKMKNRGDERRARARERVLANIGWTDEARAASLAVRQAKAKNGAGAADGRAMRIRNRAHELRKTEGIPFSAAFRRAEKELSGK